MINMSDVTNITGSIIDQPAIRGYSNIYETLSTEECRYIAPVSITTDNYTVTDNFRVYDENYDNKYCIGTVSPGDAFPTIGRSGGALVNGDYVKPDPSATYPFSIIDTVSGDTITFYHDRSRAVYYTDYPGWMEDVAIATVAMSELTVSLLTLDPDRYGDLYDHAWRGSCVHIGNTSGTAWVTIEYEDYTGTTKTEVVSIQVTEDDTAYVGNGPSLRDLIGDYSGVCTYLWGAVSAGGPTIELPDDCATFISLVRDRDSMLASGSEVLWSLRVGYSIPNEIVRIHDENGRQLWSKYG